MRQMLSACLLLVVLANASWAQLPAPTDPLTYDFSDRYGQVEVGGRFTGAEFHASGPLPSRISFYYPVANSVDLSTDYWKRRESQPMAVGVCIDGGPRYWIGREAWRYRLSPHTVTFFREEGGLTFSMRYDFGYREPVMVYRLTVRNTALKPKRVEVYLHLKTTLRTCQTYARFDSAWVSYDSVNLASVARFDEPQTGNASVVVQNAGAKPSGWTFDAGQLAVIDTGTSSWVRSRSGLGQWSGSRERRLKAFSAFTYNRELTAEDSLAVVLLIGSCRSDEAASVAERLRTTWSGDVEAYDCFIRTKAMGGAVLRTGDTWVDRSVFWANALLAANAHYLDGMVVPMPCPAEYNFFFTHDMLLTDLAATAFDTDRVKRDLSYIVAQARDSVIPHAYYWRDDGFKTEFCAPDNWNHLWFVLTTGSYIRHTTDSAFGERLYPLVTRSLKDALQQLRSDSLMHAFSPDWWDIGKNEGPRAYMTTLIVRALREYAFISSFLGKSSPELVEYERIADAAQLALNRRLWDQQMHYLINFNGSLKDPHYYMGSLLAPVFGLLSPVRSRQLVQTAERELLAPGIGLRTAMPPDFHTDSMRAFFQFAGNEAGDPYLYANGGVWSHNNAWYVLALRSVGRLDDAFRFFRATMTLDGIASSPMGQPAMYEYRYSDPASEEYGRIDKPSFLWAAGFSLFTAYRLIGIDDNEWNVSFSGTLPSGLDSIRCQFAFGEKKQITISGRQSGLRSFAADDVAVPSLVVPLDVRSTARWELRTGKLTTPYLERINAVLHSAHFDENARTLRLSIASFPGHHVSAMVIAAARPRAVIVDGRKVKDVEVHVRPGGTVSALLHFSGVASRQTVVVQF